MKIISKFLLCALLAPLAVFTSCNSDDDPKPQLESFMAFVTLTQNNDNGCIFITQEKDDSEVVTYTCSQKLDEKSFKVGERYLINFSNESGKRFQSGPIVFHGYLPIASSKSQAKPHTLINEYTSDPVNVSMVERAGTYINVEATAPVAYQLREFAIYVDETTVNNEYPEAYIVLKTDNVGASDKIFYGSFDLSPVWMLSTCKGVNLHYNTTNGTKKQVFTKSVSGFKPSL